MLVQILSQIKKGKPKSSTCGFSFGDSCCGDPAVAVIGTTPVCLEHLEYASELSPGYSYRLYYGGKMVTVDRTDFVKTARKEVSGG